MIRGVVLYGPPASGKDTIDAALRDLSLEYAQFALLRVGPGRSTGYSTVPASQPGPNLTHPEGQTRRKRLAR